MGNRTGASPVARPLGPHCGLLHALVLWVHDRGHDDPRGVPGVFDTSPETFFPQLDESAAYRPGVEVADDCSDVRVVARQRHVLYDGENLLPVRVALRVGQPRVDLPSIVFCHADGATRWRPSDAPDMRSCRATSGRPSEPELGSTQMSC
jgi:hypothetical protein